MSLRPIVGGVRSAYRLAVRCESEHIMGASKELPNVIHAVKVMGASKELPNVIYAMEEMGNGCERGTAHCT